MRVPIAAALLLLGATGLEAQWQTVAPGGPTVCSDGSPFQFFVHGGDPAKLLIEFEGGGACWDDATCAQPIYSRRITLDLVQLEQRGLLAGIYDRRNPDNPFRDWSHVYVPYCTGDLHWGDNTKTYTGPAGPYTVQHRGAVNAAAALGWVYENVAAPSQVFVAGCSAGGYGSILWSAHVMARYSGASAVQLSDSAAGIVPAGFFGTPLTNWNVRTAWPSFISALDLDRLDTARVTLADFYGGVAGHYPLSAFSQFNYTADTTQAFFYALTKGGPTSVEEWGGLMQGSIASIQSSNPNFFGYTAPGTQHCVINSASLYSTQVGGVRLVDWIRRLAETRAPGSVP